MTHINTQHRDVPEIGSEIASFIAVLLDCKRRVYPDIFPEFFFLRDYTDKQIEDILTSQSSSEGDIQAFTSHNISINYKISTIRKKSLD